MSEYPNSDEEFELQYGDELELLNQQDDFDEPIIKTTHTNARRSLDFPASQNKLNDVSDGCQPLPDTSFEITTVAQEPRNEKKRTIEELFGDIDDLLYENRNRSKKAKPLTKQEEQLTMIEMILEMRKQKKDKEFMLHQRTSTLKEDRNKANLSRRVPSFPFVPVTSYCGDRFYIRCHSENYEKEERESIIKEINCVGAMGGLFENTWKEAEALLCKSLDVDLKKQEEIELKLSEIHDTNLWVDVYKPKRYIELLSDEATNKILLKWLKLWDKVVFKRQPKILTKPATKQTGKFPNQQFDVLQNQLVLDEDGRPKYKIALLCGRPGLGKTTLAHIVAKHCGYNVIEINASDDRSLDFFKKSLENATRMTSVVDKEKRPNCLVFDEIDGAPAPSVEYLIKFVTGAVKKGKAPKRPIICICNDVYAPSLRSLRQMAFVVNFPATSSVKLSERLMQIARRERLKTDAGSMLALAEKSNNDVRSCLSILHFFKARNLPVTLSDVYKSGVGQKDVQKGLFAVWTDIFSIERARQKLSNDSNGHDTSNRYRMRKILDIVQAFGDYERLSQGVFENYAHMQIKEGSLVGVCHALDWFCLNDKFGRWVATTQNYSIATYMAYAFVVWHFQFSSFTWPKVKYPKESYEVRQKLANNVATLATLRKGLRANVSTFLDERNLVLDVLSPLTRIITPTFRPVNFHLFTNLEKDVFNRVVDVMLDYNLNYVQDKNPSGVYEYKLDPDVLSIVVYPNISNGRNQLPYVLKQLIAREVEMRKIKTSLPDDGAQLKVVTSPSDDKNLPNHLQRLKVKKWKKTEPVVSKDFFGRIIEAKPDIDPKNCNLRNAQLNNDIWFKYKEGYSNAVKKKIKMGALY